jgi:hypothetical protein
MKSILVLMAVFLGGCASCIEGHDANVRSQCFSGAVICDDISILRGRSCLRGDPSPHQRMQLEAIERARQAR